ncbi:MAG: hypothetical protein HKN73_05540 [Gemmatimonadetes bacterium]|nr:hypothetical protein [Gemmatimonadota bacterium]
MRAERSTDTVEISAQARAAIEQQTERIGLLPQLVVRMTGRLRAAFFDRPEITSESTADLARSRPARGDVAAPSAPEANSSQAVMDATPASGDRSLPLTDGPDRTLGNTGG